MTIANTTIVAPKCGRLHFVNVPVDESIDWIAAINEGFPDTRADAQELRMDPSWRLAEQKARLAERKVILVNFGLEIEDVYVALSWGRENKLVPASARTVWALGRHRPRLHDELKQGSLIIASLEEAYVLNYKVALYGHWCGSERKVAYKGFDCKWKESWFAFDQRATH